MGSVYEAVGSDGWEVALKIIQLPSRQHEMLRHRVRREAEVLLGLNHPRIVRAFDFIEEADRAILVLEKLKGESLRSHLIQRSIENRQLEASEVRSLLTGLVAGLGEVHRKGWIHRDLKPSNIMLVDGRLDRAKLLDFGIAKELEAMHTEGTTQGRRVGSLTYMAPEQLLSGRTSVRTDVFSLGVLLFEWLTLRRPWLWDEHGVPIPISAAKMLSADLRQRNPMGQLVARIMDPNARPLPSQFRPGPARLDELVQNMLAVDPIDRFPSVTGLLEQADPLLREEGPSRAELAADPQTMAPSPSFEPESDYEVVVHPTASPVSEPGRRSSSVSELGQAAVQRRTRRTLSLALAIGCVAGFVARLGWAALTPMG